MEFMLGINWVDLAIIVVLLLFVMDAFGRPLILELVDFLSFLLAFFLSFLLYNIPARFFEAQFKIPHGLTLVLGFISVWFLSETCFYLLVRIIFPKIPRPKIFRSKVLSVIPALMRGLIFLALILVMIASFPIQPTIKKSVLDSKIGSQILKSAYTLEQPVKQVFGGVVNDSFSFLTIEPKTNESINLGFQTSQFSVDGASENTMIDLVNKERTSRGIKALVFNSRLRDIARGHSEDMMKRGYFSHYSPEGKTVADRAENVNIDFLVIGENLAYAPNVELAHQGLMNSEGHRANILSTDYGKIGIGVIDAGIYGRMFTQVFTN